ncbi:hypothetical protein [Streptomyces sp. NPDC006195]|uniref:hypothetical protein n=1 Tax=unclassified Streptomyces TaxID=2593676 RepID=UPI0033BED72B
MSSCCGDVRDGACGGIDGEVVDCDPAEDRVQFSGPVQVPSQCFGLAVVAVGQTLVDDWQCSPQPAHREINAYSVGQSLPLIVLLDHTGEYEARRSRIEVVAGDAPQVPQQHAEVEPITGRSGPRLPQPVKVEHGMRGSGLSEKVTDCVGNGSFSHTDGAVDQEGPSAPGLSVCIPASYVEVHGTRMRILVGGHRQGAATPDEMSSQGV